MRFSQDEQDQMKLVVQEFKSAAVAYSQACKVYTPFRIAADYPLASAETIVAHHLALKVYKEECKKYHAARDRYVSIIRSQTVKMPSISNAELSSEVKTSIKDVKYQDQMLMVSARQKAMAYAVLTRNRATETPEQAGERGLREYDALQENTVTEFASFTAKTEPIVFEDSTWNSVSEKDDPTLGDFEALPESSIAAEPREEKKQ